VKVFVHYLPALSLVHCGLISAALLPLLQQQQSACWFLFISS